jgi:F-box-like
MANFPRRARAASRVARLYGNPTPEELKKAKETIKLVQRDLETAMEVLAQAQLRVEILKKDLEERNAWIAPARRLPFDVLSMIFDWCSDIKWDSPAQIAAVCRTWRRVVLDTPRAWSFIDLASKMTDEGITMFFERSRQRPLHVYLPEDRRFDLSSVAHRIHCISLDDIRSLPQTLVFPNLRRLSIFWPASALPLAEVTAHRFPALRHLGTTSVPLPPTAVEKNISLPQIESWSLFIPRGRAWLDGLPSCQNTLVSLSLDFHRIGTGAELPSILLPVLRCLTIAGYTLDSGLLNLRTPILETYAEFIYERGPLESPIHTDVSTVTQMRFTTKEQLGLTLSRCLGLQRLQLCGMGIVAVAPFLDQLSVDEQICPRLRIIELFVEDLNPNIAAYSERLAEISSSRVYPIEITASAKRAVPELPGTVPESVGLHFLY